MPDDYYTEYYSKTYYKFSDKLVGYVSTIIHDSDAAMDILHDSFLKLYEKKVPLDPERESTFAYLCMVLKNAAIDYIKKKVSENKKINRFALEEVIMDNNFYTDVEDVYIEGEILSTLNDTINSFPEHEKLILLGNIIQGKPLKAVAVDNDISVHRVKRILKKFTMAAKQNLKVYFF